MDTAQKKEPEDGRLVQYLLMNPTNDGGQWDMLVNIVGESLSLMGFQALPLGIGHFFSGYIDSDCLPRRLHSYELLLLILTCEAHLF